MVTSKLLPPAVLRVLAEIHVTGLWLWVRDVSGFLADPRHTPVNKTAVEVLLRGGYLEEDREELELHVSQLGKELLGQNPEAVAQARAIHAVRQALTT